MRFEDNINAMIEWGKEENQPDYVEFVEFLRDCHADKKPVVVEENGTGTEFVLCDIIFMFKKPFHDFDISLQYYVDEAKKKRGSVSFDYTFMDKFKKLGDRKFLFTGEDGREAVIRGK